MPEDELYVIRDASEKGFGEQARYLIDRLNNKVLRYRTVASVSDIAFQEGRTYRILIASDSDAFLTGATRAAAIEAARNRDIILYSTSRIRSTIGTNVNDLYNTKTRLTASYYIDTAPRPSRTSCWPTGRSSGANPAPSPSRATTRCAISPAPAPTTDDAGTAGSRNTRRRACILTSNSNVG